MIRVLIVEDEPALARGLSLLITKIILTLRFLASAKMAEMDFRIILELEPELVFTDITMPVMNGLDMIEEVQKAHFHTRFVILTGYADFEYARKAIHLGVSDYLLKPIVPKTLEDILHSCLEQQKAKIHLLQKEYLQCALRSNNPVEPAPDFMDSTSCSFILFFRGHCVPVYTARPFLIRILHRFLLNI